MKRINKIVKMAVVLTAICFTNQAFAGSGDTAIASINLSGSVPEVFSVTARGIPGDLDLTPNVVVVDRLIGILHFKFNESAASITVASSTASGGPEGASAYTFSTAFTVESLACTSIDLGASPGATLAIAGADFKTLAANPLVGNGIEEDCQLVASWGGTVAALPLAGVYSMSVTVTMVAL